MSSRTWNLKLIATDEFPETTLHGVSQDDAVQIVQGLMNGPASVEYKRVEAAVSTIAHSSRAAA